MYCTRRVTGVRSVKILESHYKPTMYSPIQIAIRIIHM